ncbi:MAG: hypothetical protein LBP76_00205 [Treponema sp.]|jgi:hypothetical protein|nr:hypothetical protein [Treponema sp.]
MNVSINGVKADIKFDTEENLGEAVSGIELWLHDQGCFLSGLEVDGEVVRAEALESFSARKLDGINTLDINVLSWQELAVQAYLTARDTLNSYQNAVFNEKQTVKADWEGCAAARFLSDHIPDISELIRLCLSGEGPGTAALLTLIDERLRELQAPEAEFSNMEALVSGIAVRLQDLPLDMQTGKDERASETVQIFSHGMEKIYRLLYVLKFKGLNVENIRVEALSFRDFNDEFGAALKELVAAFQVKDSVLVGDLAEYELAPRLVKLYSALKELV